MNNKNQLRAGAGTSELNFSGILPLEGFTSVQNAMHVRALILEGNQRIAIVSVELTSIFEEVREHMINRICVLADAPRENVWLTLTHSFAGPHIWPNTPEQHGRERRQEDIVKGEKLKEAYYDALEAAVTIAATHMQDAVIGAGKGECKVNSSRNLLTREGWTLGTDDEEICDHIVNVLRVDSVTGAPIAMLYTYGVRSCVMLHCKDTEGGGIISSDLCGAASMALEKEFGNSFTAMFLCGAADLEPRLKGFDTVADRNGDAQRMDFSANAATLLNAQASRLAADALKIWRRIENLTYDPEIRTGTEKIICVKKKANPSGDPANASKQSEFITDGEETQTIYAMRLDVMNLIGVQPELDAIGVMELSQAIPGEITATAIMVNGSGKCMPSLQAYKCLNFHSIHSPYMPGTAERMRNEAVALLQSL